MDDDAPQLMTSGSGGGGGRSVDVSFWLSPLPRAGDLTIVCAWPGRGIAETQTGIGADALAAARAAVSELWPWQPPSDTPPPARPLPDLPSGWFKNALDRTADFFSA